MTRVFATQFRIPVDSLSLQVAESLRCHHSTNDELRRPQNARALGEGHFGHRRYDCLVLANSFDQVVVGTAGLGKTTITTLAQHNPEHVFFSGRDDKKASRIVDSITATIPQAKVTFIKCDLASLASIDEASRQLLSSIKRLDILIW